MGFHLVRQENTTRHNLRLIGIVIVSFVVNELPSLCRLFDGAGTNISLSVIQRKCELVSGIQEQSQKHYFLSISVMSFEEVRVLVVESLGGMKKGKDLQRCWKLIVQISTTPFF